MQRKTCDPVDYKFEDIPVGLKEILETEQLYRLKLNRYGDRSQVLIDYDKAESVNKRLSEGLCWLEKENKRLAQRVQIRHDTRRSLHQTESNTTL